jgi:hypothetical protein
MLGATPGTAATVACDPAALVSALAAVSGSGQGGTISLTPGCTYAMSAVNNSADGNNAFPDVLGNVTVVGNGATITRSSAATDSFRYFLVDDGGSLTLSDLTITGGTVPAGEVHGGGAIMNRSSLTVTGVTFSHNQSLADTGGGAIDNHDYGRLVVSGSTFDHNVGLQGGAIENEATYCHATEPLCASATVTDSTFTSNSTTQYGGGGFEGQHGQSGIALCGPTWPQASMCQRPGGTHNTLVRDTFAGNAAMTEGGGVATFGTTSISDSTFTGNSIIGTSSEGDLGGGGIQTTGVLALTQTTLAGDRSGHGGELHAYDVQYLSTDPTPGATVSQTILAASGSNASCSGSGTVSDAGYNLADDSTCPFSSSHGSRSSTDPQLGSLADNGGPTPTMALLSGSPAIDAVPTSAAGCSGGSDQRGVSRPQGSGCDVGAYEAGGTPPSSPPPTTTPPTTTPPTSTRPSPSRTPSTSVSPSRTPSPTATTPPLGSPSASATSDPAAGSPGPQPSTDPRDVAVGTANAVPAAGAAGVTTGRGVVRVRTADGLALVVRPGATVTIRFTGQHIELQFLGTPSSGWIRVTIGTTHRDIDLRTAHPRRWRFTFRATGSGTHVLRITSLTRARNRPRSGPAVLSRIHVLPAARSSVRAV